MNYLNCLPAGFKDEADWALVLGDGTRLPVHSQLLRITSPVLVGQAITRKSGKSKFAAEVHFEGDPVVATHFLAWLYHHKFKWTLPLAKELANLSHLWEIPGDETLL